jgi:tripartite-type tricarboxylate transporter receptor subunit TctC
MKLASLVAVALAAAAGLTAQPAAAAFPDHPIRLITPAGAGGVTDNLARALAQGMTTEMGQQIFVDNRVGASGIIGSEAVATAPPDGYTLLMAFPSHAANPSLFKLPYDSVKSFAPVSLVSNVALVMVVNSDSPANNVKQLIDLARSKPGQLNFGSVGVGSLGHLGAELFCSMAGIKMVHVPYKGAPQVLTAVMANEIGMYLVASVSGVTPQTKTGRLKALGVSTTRRLSVLPDVPAISETLAGYEASGWNGILAPAGTPKPVVDYLQAAVATAIKSPAFVAQLNLEGAIPVGSTPEQFDVVIRKDIARWGAVIKAAGIKAE